MVLFTFFDENTQITHCLEILGPEKHLKETLKDSETFLDAVMDKINDKNLEILYGVHDISMSNNELLGFTTYEVHAHKWNDLMKIWRGILTELGFRVGKYIKK